ncbi:hypothetical protein [Microbacterium sp.]|uniref:hypothetical protein n=1 Tax=Microbacterium sp. TaxID=51671 RepID=UPI00257A6160|nr:hypothetical protein [Microbacterium sp.]
MSTSATGIDVTLPAPSTRPTPPEAAGVRWPSPAAARARATVTSRSNHTSPVNPDAMIRSDASPGNTRARTRPSAVTSIGTPSRGFPPRARFRIVRASHSVETRVMYGPVNHSSPRRGWPGGRLFETAAASAHSSLTAAVLAWMLSRSVAR